MHGQLVRSRRALQSLGLCSAAGQFFKHKQIAQPSRLGGRRTLASLNSGQTVMDADVEAVVRRLHSTNHKMVVYVTGGASQALGWLLCVPGASNTVLELTVPYARESLVDVLGKEPSQYCSEETAVDIAKAAYRRAANLANEGDPILGVSATCALATEPPKKGAHRLYIAVHNGMRTAVVSATLAKGARSRAEEDGVASRLLLQAVGRECGVETGDVDMQLRGRPEEVEEGNGSYDAVTESSSELGDPLEAVLSGQIRCVEYCRGQVRVDAPRRNRVILSGSFNPLHMGHKELLAAACSFAGPDVEGCFELSVGNPDKGWLPIQEARRRVRQFVDEELPIMVTSAPLFINKIPVFPGCSFVVGWDTAVRLVDPKYHEDDMGLLLQEFQEFRKAGCSFVVAGRKDYKSGIYRTAQDVEIPPQLADLFTALPEFRIDISSTELRAVAAPLPPSVPNSQPSSQPASAAPSRPPTP